MEGELRSQPPAPQRCGTSGSNLWLPAWLQRAQPPPRPAFQASEEAQDERGPAATAPSLLKPQGGSGLEGGAGAFLTWDVSLRPSRATLTPHPSISFIPVNSCITAN
ncbi:hypothetical protein VULLAG_LOCUS3738 [Vulpes lagopus]